MNLYQICKGWGRPALRNNVMEKIDLFLLHLYKDINPTLHYLFEVDKFDEDKTDNQIFCN